MTRLWAIGVANIVLFVLFALAFIYPATSFDAAPGGGSLSFSPSVFTWLLLGFLVLYAVGYPLLARELNWGRAVETSAADEREQEIVGQATKVSYWVLIAGIIITIAVLGGMRVFELFTEIEINMYALAVTLLAGLLVTVMLVYCITWTVHYRR